MRLLHSSDISKLVDGPTNNSLAAALMEISSATNFEVATTAPKMMQLSKSLGDTALLKLIVVVLKQFNDSLNVPSMSAMQIIETAREYIVTYPLNSVKDLILCLRKAKKGEYGQIYNRLDQATIFSFITKYEEERVYYFENKRTNLKAQQDSDQMAMLKALPEETKLVIKKIGKGLKPTPNIQEALHKDTLETYLADLEMALPVATPEEIDMLKTVARKKGMVEVLNKIEEFEASLFRIDDDELNAS
jgi:hypothetical protein